MTTQNLIIRGFHGTTIRQRSDGYLNATDMCKATGKKIKNYRCNKATQEFLIALSKKLEMPIESQRKNSALDGNKGLLEITRGGNSAGTWIHSRVAIHLAIWCSPEFAVLVTDWVYELLTKGTVSLNPNKPHQEITGSGLRQLNPR
ncbi:MAG: KilA-N domain-containing protein [Candidatus Marithrix sp.]